MPAAEVGDSAGLVNPGSGPGGPPVAPPLFISLITSVGDANLSFSGTSLVILDKTRLPDLLGVTIAPGIPLYANTSEIPEAQRLPADFVLVYAEIGGDAVFAAMTSPFVIVSGFTWPGTITISAASAVAFLDTAALIATPIPAAGYLLLPCVVGLARKRR